MYYTNGNYSMGGNFKIKKQAPMDDRSTVAKKIDLQNPNLFDGFTYNGMIVSVVDDGSSNGVYRLEDKQNNAWVKESGSGSGGAGLSSEDRIKLDGIAVEATKNKTDGFLLSRSNHTGTIPMSVVENLEQVLANISLGGMTSAELLRIEGIESNITKKADLDSSGKIPASQLPDIASGRKIKVNSEADRLTVSTYPDLTIAYQMDDGSSWVINGNDDPSNINNWTKLGSALISQVSSFNGRTGNVSPETGDYTSDMITETDKKQFASKDEKISWNNRLADADRNGKLYGRKNGEWAEIVSAGANPGGAINANEKEFMLSRSNHTGLQSMDTISGLAKSLLGKADINTVYAEPMSTNYTTRNEVLEASKTIKYPLPIKTVFRDITSLPAGSSFKAKACNA